MIVALLLFSRLVHPGFADETKAPTNAEIYETIQKSEKVGRMIGSSITLGIGTSLILGGALSGGTLSSQAVLVVGGATTAIFAIKGFFVPTSVEEFVSRYSRAPDRFEPEAFRYLSDIARRNRIWDGALSTSAGALFIVAGALSPANSFGSIFSYVGGGMMILGGVSRLIFPSPTERLIAQKERFEKSGLPTVSLEPVFTTAGIGLSLTLKR
ncbi:MAG: hypothetical protein ACXWPM_11710 [Bdellovibrionota bacterium]